MEKFLFYLNILTSVCCLIFSLVLILKKGKGKLEVSVIFVMLVIGSGFVFRTLFDYYDIITFYRLEHTVFTLLPLSLSLLVEFLLDIDYKTRYKVYILLYTPIHFFTSFIPTIHDHKVWMLSFFVAEFITLFTVLKQSFSMARKGKTKVIRNIAKALIIISIMGIVGVGLDWVLKHIYNLPRISSILAFPFLYALTVILVIPVNVTLRREVRKFLWEIFFASVLSLIIVDLMKEYSWILGFQLFVGIMVLRICWNVFSLLTKQGSDKEVVFFLQRIEEIQGLSFEKMWENLQHNFSEIQRVNLIEFDKLKEEDLEDLIEYFKENSTPIIKEKILAEKYISKTSGLEIVQQLEHLFEIYSCDAVYPIMSCEKLFLISFTAESVGVHSYYFGNYIRYNVELALLRGEKSV